MEFSAYTRDRNLKRLSNTIQDLVIIGGGINGSGIAREAALRGLKTTLFEKGDFSSGTSSRSSRMIHGGLRYLKSGNFKLVRESLKERAILLNIAPDLVKPIRFLFPVYGNWLRKIIIYTGLLLYDTLAGIYKISPFESLSNKKLTSVEPLLKKQCLYGGFLYSDATVDDSKLVLSTLLSAVQNGVTAMNYLEVIKFSFIKGNWEIHYRDLITSESGILFSKSLVIAAGVWLNKFDLTNEMRRLVRSTKGIHIVIPRSKLDISHPTIVPTFDNRILFALNYKEFIYVGTTDTDYEDNPDTVFADEQDLNYILMQINNIFPTAEIQKKDIISVWAGLRPLVNKSGDPTGISREELIQVEENNLILVLGGKLTTYRATSERVIRKLVDLLGIKHNSSPSSKGIKLYKIKNRFTDIVAETRYHLKATMPLTILDMLERRIPLLRFDNDNGLKVLDKVLVEMSKHLNWDEEEILKQRNTYITNVNKIRKLLD